MIVELFSVDNMGNCDAKKKAAAEDPISASYGNSPISAANADPGPIAQSVSGEILLWRRAVTFFFFFP